MKTVVSANVHYVQGGVHYAAMVVKVLDSGEVNLVVFPNYHDELVLGSKTHGKPATSVPYAAAADAREHSWHFPEWNQ